MGSVPLGRAMMRLPEASSKAMTLLLGRVSLVTWPSTSRVAVCASVYEGLCNAIIEALACGTPVVSTNCPYGPSEILQGGRYGTLTPVGDAAAMAAAIEVALNDVPDRGALRARGLNYTTARAAERFLEIVSDLQPLPAQPSGPLAVARA